MIGIVDYGMGNLGSVQNACDFLEMPARIVTRPTEMDACEALILPGVGAFGDCMNHLGEHDFVAPIRQWLTEDRPFLGICLGLQVLFEGSEESPDTPGLGVLPGRIVRFASDAEHKVPQIGWNQVRFASPSNGWWTGIPSGTYFYFVHSYYVDTPQRDVVAGETEYGAVYTSAVARGRMIAVQFHPEKSQHFGLCLLRNFAASLTRG